MARVDRDALCTASGVSRSYLWKLEQGKASPSLAVLEKLAGAFACSIAELIGEGHVGAAGQWVAIGDRLPRDGQFVIVWIDRNWCGQDASCAGRCHYFSGEGFKLHPEAGGDVTDWMPWPQKPPGVTN